MKKINTIVLAFMFGVFAFMGCDKVESPFYETLNEEDVTVEFPDVDPATVYRKILIEEFTGHRCTNCPAGHQVLEGLQEQYGDTLVAVGIHYGSLAKPNGEKFSYDFRTDAGNEVGARYQIESIPAAIVNRNMKQGGWQRDQWANVLRDVDRKKVPAAVQIINQYDADYYSVKANVKVTLLEDYDHPLYLVIFIIEDGIVKPQKDGNQDIDNYVHNHVLRASLTDPFGFPLRGGAANWTQGDSETYAASVEFFYTDWDPENCHVVAFLLDQSNNDVLQVETANVINR